MAKLLEYIVHSAIAHGLPRLSLSLWSKKTEETTTLKGKWRVVVLPLTKWAHLESIYLGAERLLCGGYLLVQLHQPSFITMIWLWQVLFYSKNSKSSTILLHCDITGDISGLLFFPKKRVLCSTVGSLDFRSLRIITHCLHHTASSLTKFS